MHDTVVITGAAGFIGSHLARTLLACNPNRPIALYARRCTIARFVG